MDKNSGYDRDNTRLVNHPCECGNNSHLSVREREILSYTAKGMQAGTVARKLGISKRTVEAHLLNSRLKLAAKNTIEAVAIAIRRGIITGLTVVVLANAMFSTISAVRPRVSGGGRIARVMNRTRPVRNNRGGEEA